MQVVIALIVSPEGFPLAYEVLPGNTTDKSTLKSFLARIEDQYGKAQRIWVMDRGIPTEETLEQMCQSAPPVSYLVDMPTTDGREVVMGRYTQSLRELLLLLDQLKMTLPEQAPPKITG